MTALRVGLHHQVDHADAAGTPVVLVHGVGSHLQAWDDVVERLGDDRPVVRYDLRGHGRSERPPGPYTIDDLVTDHVALISALGIERAHVVGFSLGGLVAQGVALAHPDTVERLVVLSSVAGRTPEEADRVLQRLARLEQGGPSGMAAVSADRWYTESFLAAHPDVVERALEQLAANDPAAYTAAYRVLAETDLAGDLHRITVPTLAMTGEGDVGSPPRMTRLMGERIPDCVARILPEVKHAVLVEVPELVAEEIRAFIKSEETT